MSYNTQYSVDSVQTHWVIRKSWQENRSLHVQHRNNIFLNSLFFLFLLSPIFLHIFPTNPLFLFFFFSLYFHEDWYIKIGISHVSQGGLKLKIPLSLPPEGCVYTMLRLFKLNPQIWNLELHPDCQNSGKLLKRRQYWGIDLESTAICWLPLAPGSPLLWGYGGSLTLVLKQSVSARDSKRHQMTKDREGVEFKAQRRPSQARRGFQGLIWQSWWSLVGEGEPRCIGKYKGGGCSRILSSSFW